MIGYGISSYFQRDTLGFPLMANISGASSNCTWRKSNRLVLMTIPCAPGKAVDMVMIISTSSNDYDS